MENEISYPNSLLSNCTPLHYEDLANELVNDGVTMRTRVVSAAFGFICGIGLFANFALLVLLLLGGRRGATFKTPSTILIINLAIADSLLLLTLPFAIAHRLHNQWTFGVVFCKLEEILKFLSYYASVFFLTVMACDRFFTLCRPRSYDRKRAHRNLWIVSIIVWIIAILVDIPIMVYADVDDFGFCNVNFPDGEVTVEYDYSMLSTKISNITCLEQLDLSDYFYTETEMEGQDNMFVEDVVNPLSNNADTEIVLLSCKHPPLKGLHLWLICNFVIGFVFPFIVISVCYFKIWRLKSTIVSSTTKKNYRHTAEDDSSSDAEKPPRKRPAPRRLLSISIRAKMILDVLIPCLILAFLVCWLPYHTWHLAQINGVNVSSGACSVIRDITFCLAFFNSALNPILNSFFLFNFRESLQRSATWLKKVAHIRSTTKQSSAKVRFTSGRKKNAEEDRSFCDVTVIVATTLDSPRLLERQIDVENTTDSSRQYENGVAPNNIRTDGAN